MAHRLGALVSWERRQVAAICVRSLGRPHDERCSIAVPPAWQDVVHVQQPRRTDGISGPGTPEPEHSRARHIERPGLVVGFRPH